MLSILSKTLPSQLNIHSFIEEVMATKYDSEETKRLYKVRKIDDLEFVVESKDNSTSVYTVAFNPKTLSPKCECRAFHYSSGKCKHILLVEATQKLKFKGQKMSFKKDMPIQKATLVANQLIKKIQKHCNKVFIGGSIAREKDIVGDIDLAIVPKDPEALNNYCEKIGTVKRSGSKLCYLIYDGVQINLFYAPTKSWQALKLYVTGSGDLNKKMRKAAKAGGMLLNQYGLWIRAKKKGNPRKFVTANEKKIFKYLGFDYLEPTAR